MASTSTLFIMECICIFWQRNDIAMAITKFDQFDFLIDIVPRDELKPAKRQVNINPYWFSRIVVFNFSVFLVMLH